LLKIVNVSFTTKADASFRLVAWNWIVTVDFGGIGAERIQAFLSCSAQHLRSHREEAGQKDEVQKKNKG